MGNSNERCYTDNDQALEWPVYIPSCGRKCPEKPFLENEENSWTNAKRGACAFPVLIGVVTTVASKALM